ncbi:chromate efflux transporter [Amnibacterium setariae]|uniref:Chromate efflux transporter n=1 Tax=Amnibacterium setariae TaxID=2306585 RepID=A0A3A1UAV6_9MICO|nr:chromate efflux transporter [Amnibacterium setariae]RIX30466.1 chromate efflux transporter [Amnibacterium setariae]
MDVTAESQPVARHPGRPLSVLLVFLRLGLTSFGGPVAHIGYFHTEFVQRRRWLGERAYADVVALAQFLPGPASSQVGMAIGLQRAGFLGLLAAWAAFTLPSAVLLVAVALVLSRFAGLADGGWVRGLQAAAVGVVALAVLTTAKSLAPDRRRAAIAAAATVAALLVPTGALQIAVIAAAGLAVLLALRGEAPVPDPGDGFTVHVPRAVSIACLAAYGVLLAGLPLAVAATQNGGLRLFGAFYRAGALVFGGGHVVLPLLEPLTVDAGLVDRADFLAGYGAAQAVPGPLFTFSAFLGAVSSGTPTGWTGAAVALVGIFLPGALVLVGALPFWVALRRLPRVRHAIDGVNAGVVGLLAAALYDPVFTSGITSPLSLAIAVAAFVALGRLGAPPWAVVVGAALLGAVLL